MSLESLHNNLHYISSVKTGLWLPQFTWEIARRDWYSCCVHLRAGVGLHALDQTEFSKMETTILTSIIFVFGEW